MLDILDIHSYTFFASLQLEDQKHIYSMAVSPHQSLHIHDMRNQIMFFHKFKLMF